MDMKYEDAIKDLETIVSKRENNELDIDKLEEQLKQAQALVKQCREKLTKTDERLKAMLADSDNAWWLLFDSKMSIQVTYLLK